ncbi:MAG: group III truncated hemoglobin [Burkholderiales bacterium]|nr:group III truncated hemoglobin [Burkholderiales bacterium]
MPDPQLCSEEEIAELVNRFYARVRRDEQLGPIFQAHVHDWDAHLVKLTDFWSSALRGTRRFRGTPMPVHAALPGLTAGLFRHWLQLFEATAAELPNQALRKRVTELADRIAQSLWYGYQIAHQTPQDAAQIEELSHE